MKLIIDKEIIITLIMILCLMVMIFFAGYGIAYRQAVNYANDFVVDNCKEFKSYQQQFNIEEIMWLKMNITSPGGETNG